MLVKKTILLTTLCIASLFVVACSPTPTEVSTNDIAEPEMESDAHDHGTEQGHEESRSLDPLGYSCIDEELLCIGLVTAIGEVDDNSFNQAVWDGVRRAEVDLLAQVDYIETSNAAEISSNIESFVKQGYDVIVTVGSSMNVATKRAAKLYLKPHFIAVDQTGFDGMENVTGLIFPSKKIGFMAGALAANISEAGTVGVVLPGALSHEAKEIKVGFEAGAFSISPDVVVLSMHHPNLTIDSLTDPEWGAEAANQMLADGADVIFSGGGTTGNGALAETATRRDVYCIGIGTDQWLDMPEAQPCLITSVTKQLTNGVFDVIARISLNRSGHEHHPSGVFNGQIGLAPYHDFDDAISADLKATLNTIAEQLSNAEIAADGTFIHLHHGDPSASEEEITHTHDE